MLKCAKKSMKIKEICARLAGSRRLETAGTDTKMAAEWARGESLLRKLENSPGYAVLEPKKICMNYVLMKS